MSEESLGNENSLMIELTDEIQLTEEACVYVLKRTNNPDLCKVGYTSISAKGRASQYTDGDWVVHSELFMPKWLARETEKTAHSILRKYWLDPKITGGTATEIFQCSPETAAEAVLSEKVINIKRFLLSIGLSKNFIESNISPELIDIFNLNKTEIELTEEYDEEIESIKLKLDHNDYFINFVTNIPEVSTDYWSDEFRILYEYDKATKKCYDHLFELKWMRLFLASTVKI